MGWDLSFIKELDEADSEEKIVGTDTASDGSEIAYASKDGFTYYHEQGGDWDYIDRVSPIMGFIPADCGISHDGTYRAMLRDNGVLYLRDDEWGAITSESLAGDEGYSLDFDPLNEFIAVGNWIDDTEEDEPGSIHIRKQNDDLDYEYTRYIEEKPKVVKFSRDGQYLAVGTDDGVFYILERGGAWEIIEEIIPTGRRGPEIKDITWSETHLAIAVANTGRVYDIDGFNEVASESGGFGTDATAVSFHRKGYGLAVAYEIGDNIELRILSALDDFTSVLTLEDEVTDDRAYSLDFTREDDYLLLGHTGKVRVYSFTGEEPVTPKVAITSIDNISKDTMDVHCEFIEGSASDTSGSGITWTDTNTEPLKDFHPSKSPSTPQDQFTIELRSDDIRPVREYRIRAYAIDSSTEETEYSDTETEVPRDFKKEYDFNDYTSKENIDINGDGEIELSEGATQGYWISKALDFKEESLRYYEKSLLLTETEVRAGVKFFMRLQDTDEAPSRGDAWVRVRRDDELLRGSEKKFLGNKFLFIKIELEKESPIGTAERG